ncbi:hypothetical protein [Sphingobacterium sp.]|uniref:hypothetical protein n=1 Tax=Sphingobacterium sp. TaxID=341027 RepID=UPI00289E6F63|nr:hypothetical protein [Sphingobacterium sp.]
MKNLVRLQILTFCVLFLITECQTPQIDESKAMAAQKQLEENKENKRIVLEQPHLNWLPQIGLRGSRKQKLMYSISHRMEI